MPAADEAALKAALNDAPIDAALNADFLRQLVTLATTYGWEGDYYEVADFVCWCHRELGVSEPSAEALKPIERTY